MNWTTKRFHRTSSDAFADLRAACIEPPPRRTVYAPIGWLSVAAVCMVFVLIYLENLK